MEKIRLTKAMKEDIQEELMTPITKWYNEEQEKIIQEEEENFKKLYSLCKKYAHGLATSINALGYEMVNRGVNLDTFESRLSHDIEYICTSKLDRIKGNKKLSQLREKFITRTIEVNKALTQIELECALGMNKEEFMWLLNSYKKKLGKGL